MRPFLIAAFSALLLLTAPSDSRAQAVTTDWMTSGEYQAYLQSQLGGSRQMLTHVEAGEFYGQIYYFASFIPQPNGVGWATHHGLSDATFAQRNQEFTAQGYALVYQQRFVSSSGRVANQGIWQR